MEGGGYERRLGKVGRNAEHDKKKRKGKKLSGETEIKVHPPVELVSASVRWTRNCPTSYIHEAPTIAQAKLQGQK